MNSQELRALQEAYSQVYELDEVKVELKQRNKNEMQRKAGNLGREVVSSKKGPKRTAAMNRMGKLVSSIARDDEEKRFKTLGQSPAHNEEVDLYDIILSHLLDEGYADTEQAAEAIMVNMSEDWRESILSEDPVQDYRDMKRSKENAAGMRGQELTHSATQKTATRAFAARATNEFESDGADYNYTKGGKSKADETKRRIEKKHGKAAGQHAERAAHARIFGRKKTALTSMPPKPTKTNEAVDLYDIILSHLLDEGYADTEQAAEAIMVNMSEDWRESIVEQILLVETWCNECRF
jgi:hypothetical protein